MHPFTLTLVAKDRQERLLADAARQRLHARPRRTRTLRRPPDTVRS